MALIGFSILVASFTFLCFRHPPTSWPLFSWLRPSPPRTRDFVVASPALADENQVESFPVTSQEGAVAIEKQAQLDRMAMPPPTLKFFPLQPPSSIVPVAAAKTASPSKMVATSSSGSPPAPLFPAANSAQRASGGRGPPTLNRVPAQQAPLRSPSLLSPPLRSPLPSRGPSMSSTLAPPPTHNSIPAKPRKKVVLRPGHSPLDWAHLSNARDANLSGLPSWTPFLRVSPSVLRQHNGRQGNDAWSVLGGKVFNITPYMPYHPGGEPELMRAAGKDGTKLFGEVHPWVNWENMLESCLVGVAVGEDDESISQLEEMD